MPLQNRVDPFGEFCAVPARGLFFGNRGGRIHRDDRTLSRRRWTSRAWICCRLAFKGRHREVWGNGYTELFFLDEPTALAAGHRPCFECRRGDAVAFAAAWARAHALSAAPRAGEMDEVLHAQRLDGREKRRHRAALDALPDGAMIVLENDEPLALRGDALLPWSFAGYGPARPRPRGIEVDLVTPPAVVAVLSAGYRPQWHPSAG
ncbi:MAG TPA: hypothetical protein VGX95_07615 [Xanthobacteraceae bacterium]|jgi:hypothetical protein|nr:hypothetical protein [Xanthobacteraceae bacterium]